MPSVSARAMGRQPGRIAFGLLFGTLFALLFGLLASCSTSARSSASTSTTTSTSRPKPDPPAPPPSQSRIVQPVNIYAHSGPDMFNAATRNARTLVYVPESASSYVDVIDPTTYRVIDRYRTGERPQHVVPAWDMKTLYATNNLGNSLTPIDPRTGKIAGPNIPVEDPYNMYFTPDGHSAIVVAERRQRLDFRDPHTFALRHSVKVDCAGVDHLDFSADGSYFIASCEFAGRLVKIDLPSERIDGYLDLPGASPQDVKLEPAGKIFYVADLKLGGVHLIDGASFRSIGFIPTGTDAHGLYPSRDARHLYVSNRRGASISVIDFASRTVSATWQLPGTSPDMGGVSPDGKVLWLSGRFNDAVYAISTVDGHVISVIHVPHSPHGLCLWPQPGRYSLGHTGVTR